MSAHHPVATGDNTIPSGVTPRVDALLRLGQIALEIGSATTEGVHLKSMTFRGRCSIRLPATGRTQSGSTTGPGSGYAACASASGSP